MCQSHALHYHAGWTAERLAVMADVDAPAMRKRLQRIRDKLRREIEMDEQKSLGDRRLPGALPARIIELLATPPAPAARARTRMIVAPTLTRARGA